MKLLIGYGNTLRNDDAAGWRIVEQLTPECTDSGVKAVMAHQLLPEIAATVAQAEVAIFVDAALDGEPGAIRVVELHPLDHMEDAHALTAAGVLFLAKSLFGDYPPAYLVTITGVDFELGEVLSHPVARALPQAVATVRRLLAMKTNAG